MENHSRRYTQHERIRSRLKDSSTLIKLQSELPKLFEPEIRSSNRPIIPQDQVTIPYNTIIMQFPIRNSIIIQSIINRLNIDTSFLPVYKITIKNYVEYQSSIALIRDLQINKLKKVA
jgi:hypothetical protein